MCSSPFLCIYLWNLQSSAKIFCTQIVFFQWPKTKCHISKQFDILVYIQNLIIHLYLRLKDHLQTFMFLEDFSFVLCRPVTCLFWAERNRLLLALYNVWLKESSAAQFYLGLLCIHMAILRDLASVSQWTPISLQHLPITIALGGKERAQSKQQTQTFSEILQFHRPWFLQSCFNEQLWCIP